MDSGTIFGIVGTIAGAASVFIGWLNSRDKHRLDVAVADVNAAASNFDQATELTNQWKTTATLAWQQTAQAENKAAEALEQANAARTEARQANARADACEAREGHLRRRLGVLERRLGITDEEPPPHDPL